MDASIARIEADNERLNAFVYLDLDQARQRAQQAEQAVMSGAELGPLHGVPTAMKDLFDFKPGWPSTFGGVRALRDFMPDFYCAWAERMERAGAIIVGKTNSPVMGFRGTCDNPLFGPSRNPFDMARTPAARLVEARLPSPRAWCRSPREPTAAARSAFRPPGVASTATSIRSAASRTSRARTRSPAFTRFCSRARSRGRSRMPPL